MRRFAQTAEIAVGTALPWVDVGYLAANGLKSEISAEQRNNAMMNGKPPDCYDRNTLAIYGPRALTEGNPPAAWLAREKRKAAKSNASGQ